MQISNETLSFCICVRINNFHIIFHPRQNKKKGKSNWTPNFSEIVGIIRFYNKIVLRQHIFLKVKTSSPQRNTKLLLASKVQKFLHNLPFTGKQERRKTLHRRSNSSDRWNNSLLKETVVFDKDAKISAK